jgi:HPt (histidine-containing phosphotransfer) domain-containing protein
MSLPTARSPQWKWEPMSQTVTLDKEQLREVAMDDPGLMRELVGALVEDTAQQVKLLEIAVHEENAEQCRRLAHYCKGACANVGAISAAELLKAIEQRALAREFAECSIALARLATEVNLLREEAATL